MSVPKMLAGRIGAIGNAESTVVYRLHMVTGETLEGHLKLEEGSDYVQLTPVPTGGREHPYTVALTHVVYVQKRAQQ